MEIRCSAQSDVGRGRTLNEDTFAVDGERGIFVVADGMGGHGNGEVASRIVADVVHRNLAPAGGRGRGAAGEGGQVLRRALEEANRRVIETARGDSALAGMGATAVVVKMGSGGSYLANVGDSRAYLLRAGRFAQLTKDHTWVREQVSAGLLSETQAMRHPFRSVVTRALGGDEEVTVDVMPLDPQPGDLYLLCSDGLTAVLGDDEIRGHLERRGSLSAICRRLIDAANDRGGPDNITVVVISIEEAA